MSNDDADPADIVQGASTRAKVFACLKASPGVRHNRFTVAEATGINRWSVAGALNDLAASGQIALIREGPHKWYCYGEVPQPQLPAVVVRRQAPKTREARHHERPAAATLVPERQQAGELEIEAGGVIVVVGRNPATGRIRISLEDHAS